MRSLATLWIAVMITICAICALGRLLPHHAGAVAVCTFLTVLAWFIVDDDWDGRLKRPRLSARQMTDWHNT
jgi:hypothetical protein